jgi:hypothetical protein
MKLGVILLFLILSGCCWNSDHKNFNRNIEVPTILFNPNIAPKFVGNNNKDLAFWTTDLRLVIDQCNADKASIKTILEKTK